MSKVTYETPDGVVEVEEDNFVKDFIARATATIKEYGFMVQAVFTHNQPIHSYTVGLTPKLGYELCIIGIPATNAHIILNDLADRLIAGEQIQDGVNVEKLFGGSYFPRLKTVNFMDNFEIFRRCFGAMHTMAFFPMEVRLVLWPDREHVYPGEEDYDARSNPQTLGSVVERLDADGPICNGCANKKHTHTVH